MQVHRSAFLSLSWKDLDFSNAVFSVIGLSVRQFYSTLHLTENNLLLNACAQISISESVMKRLGFFKCSFFSVIGLSVCQIFPSLHLTENNLLLNVNAHIVIEIVKCYRLFT